MDSNHQHPPSDRTQCKVDSMETPSVKQQSESRKANKPLMEKRRRARINKSLNELKSILMESVERNPSSHSKWEKADILEMSVQYIRCIRNQRKASRSDPLSIGQFIAGYSECIRQIQKFTFDTTTPTIREKLTEHLLLYLKTFSDDAARSLQDNTCTSPGPVGIMMEESASTGDNFGSKPSNRSRRSTFSSFTSSTSPESPHGDNMDLEECNRKFINFSPGMRRDLNNNPDGKSSVGVWRPW